MNTDTKGERLQKLLAHAGVASRRQAEQMILEGQVTVNGEIVTILGTRVQPQDKVAVQGKLITVPAESLVYYVLHKPTGVITSAMDPQGRKTVVDLLREVPQRVYPIGRLDYDTSGLLLLTNDGELAYRLMHPRYGVEKTYRVGIKEKPTDEALNQLRAGVVLEDGKTAPAKVREVSRIGEGLFRFLDITIHEGRNRQVRRMFAKVGYPVASLQRIRFGPLELEPSLSIGKYRALSATEVYKLQRAVQLI
ncbi:pseudouridine synthase [Desulfitobacterium metallireducens]|nr:pseudouridine synthase [Desulfitobacterium metallireducens]